MATNLEHCGLQHFSRYPILTTMTRWLKSSAIWVNSYYLFKTRNKSKWFGMVWNAESQWHKRRGVKCYHSKLTFFFSCAQFAKIFHVFSNFKRSYSLPDPTNFHVAKSASQQAQKQDPIKHFVFRIDFYTQLESLKGQVTPNFNVLPIRSILIVVYYVSTNLRTEYFIRIDKK